MSITVEIQTKGGGNFRRRIQQWQAAVADPVPLMEEGERILIEDNERRAIAGLDCNDDKMPATLRERGIGGQWRTIKGKPVLVEPDENPPSGPPLLPHNQASRLIVLARTGHEHRPPSEWAAYIGWPGFTSDEGVEILSYHRKGEGRLPKRDVTSHPSPTALKRWQQAFRDWLQAIRSRTA
jgi:hypothetical protein